MAPCPCCHFRTLSDKRGLQICPVCYWQDDGQDVSSPTARGGPHNLVTLSEARECFATVEASDLLWIGEVRPPLPNER
jgi:hypothetical protein